MQDRYKGRFLRGKENMLSEMAAESTLHRQVDDSHGAESESTVSTSSLRITRVNCNQIFVDVRAAAFYEGRSNAPRCLAQVQRIYSKTLRSLKVVADTTSANEPLAIGTAGAQWLVYDVM